MAADVAIAEITDRRIDVGAVLDAVRDADAGAAVLFVGSVRRTTGGAVTERLTYEAYASMAAAEMRRVLTGVAEGFPVLRLAAVHRVGPLEIGEDAVAVAAGGAHRDETFAAARAAIDRIKASVPIWKQEHWRGGGVEWAGPDDAGAAFAESQAGPPA